MKVTSADITDLIIKAKGRIAQWSSDEANSINSGDDCGCNISKMKCLSWGIKVLTDGAAWLTNDQKKQIYVFMFQTGNLGEIPLNTYQGGDVTYTTGPVNISGADTFIGLLDTPDAYVAGKLLKTTGSRVIFVDDNERVTTAQLQAKIAANSGAGSMEPGSRYTITDFITLHNVPNDTILNTAAAIAMGTSVQPEEIVVTATSPNTLHPIALSPAFPGDILEYDVNNILCEDGTTPRNGWIKKRYDSVTKNEAPFDFRACYYMRMSVNAGSSNSLGNLTARDQFYSFTNGQKVIVLSGTVMYPMGVGVVQQTRLGYNQPLRAISGTVMYPSGTLYDNTHTFTNGDLIYVASGSVTYNAVVYTVGQFITIATGTGLSFTGSGTCAIFTTVAVGSSFTPTSTYGNYFLGTGTIVPLVTIPVGGSFVVSSSFGLSFSGTGMVALAYAEDYTIWIPGNGHYRSLRDTSGYNATLAQNTYDNTHTFAVGQKAYVTTTGVTYPSGTLFDNTHTFTNGDVLYVSSGSVTYNSVSYSTGQNFTIVTATGLSFTGSGTCAIYATVALGSSFTVSSTYGTGFLGAGMATVFTGTVYDNTHTFSNGNIVRVEIGSVTYNTVVYTAGQNFKFATGTGLAFTGTGLVSTYLNTVLDNTATLTTGKSYFVVNGTATYNAISYTAGQSFYVISGHTSFTGTGIVSIFSDNDWVKMVDVSNGITNWLTSSSVNIGGVTIAGDTSNKKYYLAFTHPSCLNVKIEELAGTTSSLNNIVIQGSGNFCKDLYFRTGCSDISIDGNNFLDHEFKSNTTNLIINRGCQEIEYGQGCGSMTIGAFTADVRIGKFCIDNVIGSSGRTISLDGEVQGNKIGNSCLWIHMGYDLGGNVVGHNSGDNTFEDNVYNNKLGNGCSFNKFDFGAYFNVLGAGASSIRFMGISQRNLIKAGADNLYFMTSNSNWLNNPAYTYSQCYLENTNHKTFNIDAIGLNLTSAQTGSEINPSQPQSNHNIAIPSETIGNHTSPDKSIWSIDISNVGVPSFRNLFTGTSYTLAAALGGSFEPALGNPGSDGYILSSTAAGVRSWVAPASSVWGAITGTLSDQTDLSTALAAKMPFSGGVFTGAVTMNANAASALQPVTLQQMNAALAGLWDDRGNYDASGNAFPSSGGSGTAGAILKGDIWTISVIGTLGGTAVALGDTVRALVDTPGTTASNWALSSHDYGYTPLSNTLNSANIFVGNASNVAAGVSLTLSGSAGSFALSNAGVLTMPDSATAARGLLNSTDWNIFNNKVSSQWTTSGSNIYYNTGAVMIGSTGTPLSKLHVVETSTSVPRGILVDQYSTDAVGSRITMRKGRGTFASPTTIVTADVLGSWTASGYDGTNFLDSAKILVTAVGTIGTGRTPTKMELQTMTDATTGVLTTALTLDQSQNATFAGHLTVEGVTSTGSTGSGKFVFDTAPTLGVVTVTSINKVTVTAPATSATLTLAQGSSLVTSGAFATTFLAAATTTVTLPSTSSTMARTDTSQTFTGAQTFSQGWIMDFNQRSFVNYGSGSAADITSRFTGTEQFSIVFSSLGTFGGTANTSAGRVLGIYDRAAGGYRGGINASGFLAWGSAFTPTALIHLGAGTTSIAQFRLTSGAFNTSNTNDGDLANDGARINFRVGAAVKKLAYIDDSNVGSFLHNISTPLTGATVTLTNNQYNIINPAGALATLTINLPSSPADSDTVMIKYTQAITAVTYGNGTVVDGITAPTAGGLVVLVYDSGTSSWY